MGRGNRYPAIKKARASPPRLFHNRLLFLVRGDVLVLGPVAIAGKPTTTIARTTAHADFHFDAGVPAAAITTILLDGNKWPRRIPTAAARTELATEAAATPAAKGHAKEKPAAAKPLLATALVVGLVVNGLRRDALLVPLIVGHRRLAITLVGGRWDIPLRARGSRQAKN